MQNLTHRLDGIGVFTIDDVSRQLHHDHVPSKPPQELSELDPDRSSAENHDLARKIIVLEERGVVEKARFRETGNRWNCSPRSGGDDDVGAREAASGDFHFAGRNESRRSFDDVDAKLAELLRIVV